MDPLKIELLFERIYSDLESASSERAQLFSLYEFLKVIDGVYKPYESYLLQLFEYIPVVKNPLLFTGFEPEELEFFITSCHAASNAIPELSEDEKLQQKILNLENGLRQINDWLGIREPEKFLGSLQLKKEVAHKEESNVASTGEVFIPVVEKNSTGRFSGRLRKLSVQLVGKSKKKEYLLRAVFGVIGAEAGNVGVKPAQVAGNMLQKSVEKAKYWIGTANFELNHAWHSGSSANLALTALYYCEMLKAENKREYFRLNPSIALTGDINEQGLVTGVDEDTLQFKIEAAFFSWVQIIVVPKSQLIQASKYLEDLETKYPTRNLILKSVGEVEELFFDRRITLHSKTSFIEHTAKKIWKKKNPASVVVVFTLLLSVIAGLVYGPIDKNPVSVEFAGEFLVLENKNGVEVGRLEIGSGLVEALEANNTFNPKVLLYDLNKDGVNELIWANNTTNALIKPTFLQAYSVLEDSVIWERPIKMNYEFPRQNFGIEEAMNIQELAFIDDFGIPKLISLSNVTLFFPSVVSIINMLTGEIEQEYVHTGSIKDMGIDDINDDGKSEIILTGVNNAFWQACVIVLDPENLHGHSPLDGDYIIKDLERAEELYYVMLPKTVTGEYLSYLEKHASGYQVYIDPEKRTLIVDITETHRSLNSFNKRSSYFVYLDYEMQATGFGTGDLYDIIARELYEDGHIPFIPDYDYWQGFRDSLIYWGGGG